MSFPRVNGLRGIEFGTKGKQREKLNSLVLTGIKKATAGTLESDYKAEGEEIEEVGEHLAVLDNEGNQVAVIKATKIEVRKFSEVPDEFALAEGEGDLSGDDFRKSHSDYWSRIGIEVKSDTEIVLLYFELLEQYPAGA